MEQPGRSIHKRCPGHQSRTGELATLDVWTLIFVYEQRQETKHLDIAINDQSSTWVFDGHGNSQNIPTPAPVLPKKDSTVIAGIQKQRLGEAFLSAFPTRRDLEMVVFYGLGKNLSAIAGENNLEHTIFELIQWAEAHGRLEELIIAALKQNSLNPQLMSITEQLGYDPHFTRDLSTAETAIITANFSSNVPTVFVQSPDILLQPYPPSTQQLDSKRNTRIGSAILLLALVLVGIIAFPYIIRLVQPKPIDLSCLPSTQDLLLGDCFQDNTNQWDKTNQQGKYSVNISNSSLILEDENNTLFSETIHGNPHTFTDFRLEVDANLSQGDKINGYGVFIRGEQDNLGRFKTYYSFELFGDGHYAIYKGIPQSDNRIDSMTLVDITHNDAIHTQGSINHISIMAKGTSLTFTVNKTMLQSITDDSYNTGYVALFVSNTPNTPPTAQATFSNLGIYKV